MKREDLRKVEVKICKENEKGFLENVIEEGYFHKWISVQDEARGIVELEDGSIVVVSYMNIRFIKKFKGNLIDEII